MGYGQILAGLLFLVIPTVNVVDVMPDFIGYFLIFAGLSKLKRIDAYMQKAAHYSLVMMLVNLAKPITLFMCINEQKTAQTSNITTATLIFMVLDLVFGILLFSSLTNGFTDLGYQYDDGERQSKKKLLGRFKPSIRKLPYENSVKNKQSSEYKRICRNGMKCVKYVSLPCRKAVFNGVDLLKIATLAFFVLRCVMTLVPELTTLGYKLSASGMYEQSGDSATRIALVVLCLGVGTLLGIAWYVLAAKYINGVRADEFFISRLKNAYKTKITDNPDVMHSIEYDVYKKIIFAALLFGGDLFFDACDFIPDVIPAVLLLAALFFFSKYQPAKILYAFVTALYVAMSAVCLYLQIYTSQNFYLDTGMEKPIQVQMYGVLFPISKALFAIAVILICICQLKYIKTSFRNVPMYSRGKISIGTVVIIFSQIGAAVGYFTDVISDDLLHFPVKIGRLIWDANIYVSFGSLIVYYIGMIIFMGGMEAVSNKLAGRE